MNIKEYIVDGREKSLLPDCKSAKLVWSDEFIVDYVRVFDIEK